MLQANFYKLQIKIKNYVNLFSLSLGFWIRRKTSVCGHCGWERTHPLPEKILPDLPHAYSLACQPYPLKIATKKSQQVIADFLELPRSVVGLSSLPISCFIKCQSSFWYINADVAWKMQTVVRTTTLILEVNYQGC